VRGLGGTLQAVEDGETQERQQVDVALREGDAFVHRLGDRLLALGKLGE
jgi:hypothetical protein